MTLHVLTCFFISVFALSFLVTTLVSLPSRRLDQVESLLAFKNEFILYCNKSVTNSWTHDAISFDGVLFDEDTGGVTELKLRGACLSGTLDANSSLFRLHQLKHLDLSLNNISSSLPAEFGRLTDLEFLDLHQNRFTGELPSSISNTTGLTKLNFLDISNNSLQGKVPEWLSNLPSLTATNLSHNSFDSFPNIPPTLKYVIASNNNFTGEMPLSLCNPRNLLFLDLSNNSLTGSVPRCLSKSITVLNLRHNNVTSLPDTFSNSSLRVLDVGHNQISGKLPRSLINCESLEFVDVESNRIDDTFPFWLGSLPNLQALILGSNRFHGPISSPQYPLTMFSKLRIIDISLNILDGSLPPNYFVYWSADINSSTSRLEYGRPGVKLLNIYGSIDFSGNRFVGEIPESIGLLKSLLALNLSNNGFTGHIPSSMANLTELESLDISRNRISGTIPPELGKLSFLSYINMSYNQLTGQIPQVGAGPVTGPIIPELSSNRIRGKITVETKGRPLEETELSSNSRDEVIWKMCFHQLL
ncbi:receptor like protein 20 [Raphanus sativus]|nr:receptor like protein 20 [Raphanus sativus]